MKLRKVWQYRETPIVIIILLIMITLTVMSDVFLTFENFVDLIRSNAVLAISALGMLLIIISGGIDVSSGALIAMVTVVTAKFMLGVSGNPFLVFLVGLGAGLVCGVITGLLVAKVKIPPIIATMGTMTIMNGALRWYTNGAWINGLPDEFCKIDDLWLFRTTTNGITTGIPIQLIFIVAAFLITSFILRYTIIGRGIMAMGGSPISSARMGFSNDFLHIFAYGFGGLLCGLAGVTHTSIMKTVDSNAFFGFEMQVIAAVVLGGASITGGSGSVLGTMLGVFLLAIINNGLILAHVPTFWQKIVIGVIILIAIYVDVCNTRREEKRLIKVDIET